MKLRYDELRSNLACFAFNCKLRHYVKCVNTCVTLGASRRSELTANVARARGGVERKRAIVAAAPSKRNAWKAEIDQLTKDIEAQKLKAGPYTATWQLFTLQLNLNVLVE